jgi:hypothetical protein
MVSNSKPDEHAFESSDFCSFVDRRRQDLDERISIKRHQISMAEVEIERLGYKLGVPV